MNTYTANDIVYIEGIYFLRLGVFTAMSENKSYLFDIAFDHGYVPDSEETYEMIRGDNNEQTTNQNAITKMAY